MKTAEHECEVHIERNWVCRRSAVKKIGARWYCDGHAKPMEEALEKIRLNASSGKMT